MVSGAQIHELCSVEDAALGNLILYELCLTVSKVCHLKAGRQMKNMSHLNSCLKLRVDNECKPKLVAQIFGLLAVFRRSDSGYSSTVADLCGNGTA